VNIVLWASENYYINKIQWR